MNRLQGINFGLLKSKVVLIVTGIVIVLLIVWWFAWMTPEANKLATVQQQITADNTTAAQLNMELIGLKAEKKLVQRELPYLRKVTAAIPPTEDPPGHSRFAQHPREQDGLRSLVSHPGELPEPQRRHRPFGRTCHFLGLGNPQEPVCLLEELLRNDTAHDDQQRQSRSRRHSPEHHGRG